MPHVHRWDVATATDRSGFLIDARAIRGTRPAQHGAHRVRVTVSIVLEIVWAICARASVCDISNSAQIKRRVDEAVEAHGSLGVRANDAGISGPTASVADRESDACKRVTSVDPSAIVTMTRAGESI